MPPASTVAVGAFLVANLGLNCLDWDPRSQGVMGEGCVRLACDRETEKQEINSSSDAFGNAEDMLSVLCSEFRVRFLFVG